MILGKLLKNKKGTAEVIGTMLFIIILLFFFTNVYLWHDAATKQMNNIYVQKINSPITVSIESANPSQLYVNNTGGIDATVSMLWIDVKSATPGIPDPFHGYVAISDTVVPAGVSLPIPWDITKVTPPLDSQLLSKGTTVIFKVITTVGNSASCSYTY